jgi:8-hydroxy-5-deazaflavin:NADPH oxidoreductase
MSTLANERSKSYAIIGLGKIGTAIAQAFAREGIEVAVAARRPLDMLATQIGPSLAPQRIEDAIKADVIILAVPFATHQDIGRAAESWQGRS